MATQTELAATLEALTEDHLPSRKEAVDAILAAILNSTLYADGVTASTIRAEIPEQIRKDYPKQIGSTIGHLVRKGILAVTGDYRPSMNSASGNRHRPMPVYRCNKAALRAYMNERSR